MEQGKRVLDEKFFGLGNSDWSTEESWTALTVPQAEKVPWILMGIALLGTIAIARIVQQKRR